MLIPSGSRHKPKEIVVFFYDLLCPILFNYE